MDLDDAKFRSKYDMGDPNDLNFGKDNDNNQFISNSSLETCKQSATLSALLEEEIAQLQV